MQTRQARGGNCLSARQNGAALLILLVIIILGTTGLLLNSLNRTTVATERDKKTAEVLAQAKEALIGYSATETSIFDTGYLLVPDTGWTGTPEGNSEGTVGSINISLIGKVPWKTLAISPLRDGQGECLWYVVSGRFKGGPKTNDAFNWDTLGQLDVIDTNGSAIMNNVAALIVAPGSVLDSQNRSLENPALIQCGGNYDARNYLDSYDSSNAISGEVNYFTGSTNNRAALNANNKRFVMANNDHYNDRFLFVTVEDIFRPIIRRTDFRVQISTLMNDAVFIAHLQNPLTIVSSSKGTDNVDCVNTSNLDNRTFCNNWKEMLLLTQLPAPSPSCAPTDTRVLIFGGRKIGAQVRLTTTDKTTPANYLEGVNLAAFATPIAAASNFNGASTFDPNNPSADILRCIP